MVTLFRSGFFWRFVGGFALGAAGLASMHATAATAPSAIQAPR